MATCIAATNAQVTVSDLKSASTYSSEAIDRQTQKFDPHLQAIATRMCKWAAPSYGASGEMVDRAAWIAAQVALYASLIALNTYVQNQSYQIAKMYSDISQDKWRRFQNAYAPLERKLINETMSTPEPSADYNDARNRGNNAANSAYATARNSFSKFARMYGLCADDTLDFSRSQALMRDDTVNFNFRDAEHFRDIMSDKRWNRRSDILNLGRNNSATAYSYAQSANDAFGGFAAAIAQAGTGVSNFFGYLFNRNETVYPQQFSQAARYGNNGAIMYSNASIPTI